jgi:hypothetical protein
MSFWSRGNRNAEGRSVTANRDSSLSGADGRRGSAVILVPTGSYDHSRAQSRPRIIQNRRATGWESVSNGDQLAYPEQQKWISGDVEGCACSGSHGRGRRFETCSARHCLSAPLCNCRWGFTPGPSVGRWSSVVVVRRGSVHRGCRGSVEVVEVLDRRFRCRGCRPDRHRAFSWLTNGSIGVRDVGFVGGSVSFDWTGA